MKLPKFLQKAQNWFSDFFKKITDEFNAFFKRNEDDETNKEPGKSSNESNKEPAKQKRNARFSEEPITEIKIIDPNTKNNTTKDNKRFDELLKNPNVKITNEVEETKEPNLNAKPKKFAFKAGKNINTHNKEVEFVKSHKEDDYDFVYTE